MLKRIRAKDFNEAGELVYKIIQTAGRVLFNEVVPEAAGYINDVLTKKNLRDIIGHVLNSHRCPNCFQHERYGYNLPLKVDCHSH
jgi:DNA-directed RNA polymerase subunit beta'